MRKFVEAQIKPQPFFLNPECTIDKLAKQLGTNRTYLSRFVNEECGVNFDGLMRRMRMAYAERLMYDHPELPLSHVAHGAGFGSTTTFRKAFVERFGMKPREYFQKNENL